MKIIHRAIFKELLYSFLLALAALNFVLMTEKVLALTRLLSSVGASLSDIATIVLYVQPQITVFTTPMAFLLATLLTFGRLNADSELVVMRSSGMSFRDISKPVFALGIGCFAAGILMSLLIAPASSRKLKAALSGLIAERAPYAIEEGIFNDTFKDIVVFVEDKPDRDTFRGIFLHDEREEGRPTVVYAKQGKVSGTNGESISFELSDGSLLITRGSTTTEVSFGRYSLAVPVAVSSPSKKYQELSPGRLLKEAKTGSLRDRKKMILEFHRRLTLPSVCLVLMLLGPPLSLKAGRTGRLGGLSVGLLVFAAYYGALMYGESLVRANKVPHYIGAWAPAMALGTVAVLVFRKTESS